MSVFMRLRLLAAALVIGFLLVVGFRLNGLPFLPQARFSDAVVSHWPAAYYLRESVFEYGQFPLWREAHMGGQPFAANPLNKTAYPLQLLALVFEPSLFLNLMILLHMFIAGWGMWTWARSLGLRGEAAVLSALAYVLAPKLVGHLGAGHVDVLYALAWWPWLMWSARGFAAPAASWRKNLYDVLRMMIFAALVFLADVRLSLFAFGLAGAYALWEMRRRRQWRRGVWLLPTGALVVVLTLSVTVPLLLWRPYLNRGDLTLADAGVQSLEVGHLVGLLLPPHEGTPESLAYLGLSGLLLAGAAVVSAPRKHAFWLLVIVIALLWALGINGFLWPVLVGIVPGLLWFRVPARAWFVVVIVTCLLAGYGLEALMNMTQRLRDAGELPRLALRRLLSAGGMGAALFCGGFTLAVLPDFPVTMGIGVALVGLLLGVVLLLALYGRLRPEQLALALLLVTFADLAWAGRNWTAWRGEDQWLTHQTALANWLEEAEPGRIYSPNYALEQQVAAAYDLRLFYGVDPFQLTGVVEAIEQASGVPDDAYSVVQPPLTGIESDAEIDRANCDAPVDLRVLATWDVRYVLSRCALNQFAEPQAVINGVYVYANPEFDNGQSLSAMGWPQDWPELPDEQTVAQLNQITLISAFVSGIGFVICLILLWVMRKYA